MESKLQEKTSDAQPVPVYMLPWVSRDDELSLIDLWRVFAARKLLILLSVLVTVMLASAYAFLVEPVYRSTAYLLPPQQQDIQSLIVHDRGREEEYFKQYTTDYVYSVFLRNFKSKGIRRDFFDTHNLAEYYFAGEPHADTDIDRIFEKEFDANLLVQGDAQDVSFVAASFRGRDPELTAQRLNQFIAFVNERTVNQLYDEVNTWIRSEIEWLQYDLTSRTKQAAQSRKDLIAKLREALSVATAIEHVDNLSETKNNMRMAIGVGSSQPPLYLRGVQALEAEISALESRKSDEPFTPGLRIEQDKLAFLSGISIDRDKLSSVTIDSAASVPYQAEKPRRKLIVMLAAVLGLIIGVSLAFLADFWSKVRAQSMHAL